MAFSFNVEGIKKAIPNVRRIDQYLDSSRSIISSIFIPKDFSDAGQLRSIPNNIDNIREQNKTNENWLIQKINSFTDVEKKIANQLNNSFTAFNPSINTAHKSGTNSINQIGAKIAKIENSDISSFIENTKKTTFSIIDYVASGKILSDPVDLAKQTGSKVVENIKNGFEWMLNTGAEIKEGVENFYNDKIKPAYESVKATVSSGCNWLYENILEPSWDFVKTTFASVANVIVSFVKGIGQLLESIFDLVVIIGTGVTSVATGIGDGVSYLVSLANGNQEEWSSITGDMWKGVMGFVAEDHVGNWFKDFYEKNAIGKWLDENAINALKSDSTINNIVSGIGYVAGIIALTVATLRTWRSSNSRGWIIYNCICCICNSSWNWEVYSRTLGKCKRCIMGRYEKKV